MDPLEEGYSLNISHGEVVHVGDNINNLSLSIGDMLGSSPNIKSTSISVRFPLVS